MQSLFSKSFTPISVLTLLTSRMHKGKGGVANGTAKFPEELQINLNNNATNPLKICDDKDIPKWLTQILPSPKDYTLDENIMFIGYLKWENYKVYEIQLHAIISAEEPIKSLYSPDKKSAPITYYRLDFNDKKIGPLFKESFPHIHCTPHEEPRFPLSLNQGNLLSTFLEFIYLNHFYEEWLSWAKEASTLPSEKFDTIEKAFNDSKINHLSKEINELKKLLFQSKEKIIKAHRIPDIELSLTHHYP